MLSEAFPLPHRTHPSRRHLFTTADPLPTDLRDALNQIHGRKGAHHIEPTRVPQPPLTPGQHLLKPIRRVIESVNDTLKGQLNLELHGGRTVTGVGARIPQGTVALTAAIWQNRHTGQPITRALITYDH
uniref:hypothetical protein n=1 Tax=Nonomuraea phyllanthi TaxID=2219224 RepID=UPI001D15B178|nr:hypothetical protein [Nonomuraea phyllanthi]